MVSCQGNFYGILALFVGENLVTENLVTDGTKPYHFLCRKLRRAVSNAAKLPSVTSPSRFLTPGISKGERNQGRRTVCRR
jgi:hypothetical protein